MSNLPTFAPFKHFCSHLITFGLISFKFGLVEPFSMQITGLLSRYKKIAFFTNFSHFCLQKLYFGYCSIPFTGSASNLAWWTAAMKRWHLHYRNFEKCHICILAPFKHFCSHLITVDLISFKFGLVVVLVCWLQAYYLDLNSLNLWSISAIFIFQNYTLGYCSIPIYRICLKFGMMNSCYATMMSAL